MFINVRTEGDSVLVLSRDGCDEILFSDESQPNKPFSIVLRSLYDATRLKPASVRFKSALHPPKSSKSSKFIDEARTFHSELIKMFQGDRSGAATKTALNRGRPSTSAASRRNKEFFVKCPHPSTGSE